MGEGRMGQDYRLCFCFLCLSGFVVSCLWLLYWCLVQVVVFNIRGMPFPFLITSKPVAVGAHLPHDFMADAGTFLTCAWERGMRNTRHTHRPA